ncbi:GNAT family N-acetyltransferase [Oryzobacter sp. R7]|uniref:GNAT family N-acetyltransferase n=1 Tax=Oryzobacter faecalis TaxID=3388656 RepID=UPI00398D16DF
MPAPPPREPTSTDAANGSVEIRRARPDDLDVAGDLTADAYVGAGVIPADAPYLAFLRDAAHRDREAELWVAEVDGVVVGTVTYVEPGSALVEIARVDEAEMRSLAVSPAATGAGVGEALTRHVIELARSRGYGALVLSSSTTMHAAHRLYGRLGFARLPERDWSPVADVHLVAYILPLRE